MIKFLHSSWAFLVLFIFLLTISNYIYAYIKNRVFNFNLDFRLASFTLIILYIQIILGFINWFTSSYFQGIKDGQMGVYMKNSHDRLLVMEHPVMMLVALLLVHYGFRRMKKAESSKKKYMAIILFYTLAFLLILVRIPWKTWL